MDSQNLDVPQLGGLCKAKISYSSGEERRTLTPSSVLRTDQSERIWDCSGPGEWFLVWLLIQS